MLSLNFITYDKYSEEDSICHLTHKPSYASLFTFHLWFLLLQFSWFSLYNRTQFCCLVIKTCLTFVTPWNVAHHTSQPVGFLRQEYWSGLPFPSSGHLPNPGIKSLSSASGWWFFTIELSGGSNSWVQVGQAYKKLIKNKIIQMLHNIQLFLWLCWWKLGFDCCWPYFFILIFQRDFRMIYFMKWEEIGF